MYRKHFTLPIAVLATVGALFAGCGGDDDTGGSARDSSPIAVNDTDVEFAQRMIPHHQQAVDMAQMVPADGVSPELVELADAVEAAQQPEIDQMTAMLERWGEDGSSPEPGGHAGHGSAGMTMEDEMSAEDVERV